jgi:hypothetical protein
MSADATPTRLSATARTALEGAADHPEHRVELPVLPAAARNGVIRSMLRAGLVEEVASVGEDGAVPKLRATAAGLLAVAFQVSQEVAGPYDEPRQAPSKIEGGGSVVLPPADVAPAAPDAPVGRTTPRVAAEALLAAWDAQHGVTEAVAALRAALARRERPVVSSTPRKLRTGTKHAQVLALLGRTDGATIAQVMELTGWAPHTVRGFLAGLKRKAISVEVLERVRQVGSGKQGAKGSYSVYRIALGEAG